MNSTDETRLRVILSDEEYIRERIRPLIRDVNYLSFIDLYQAVEKIVSQVEGSVFDYGCGGSPYRSSFKRCQDYVRADIAAGPSVDRVLLPDGSTAERSESYDFILSSQVLEHVKEPGRYVEECRRILKPGGRILITTHGMFQEHGCPYDFYRWTSRGLEELLAVENFKILESFKMTTEVRAVIQLSHHFVEHLRCPERPVLHLLFAVLRKCYGWFGIPVLNYLGRAFAYQGVVPGTNASSVYVGVGVVAEKPR